MPVHHCCSKGCSRASQKIGHLPCKHNFKQKASCHRAGAQQTRSNDSLPIHKSLAKAPGGSGPRKRAWAEEQTCELAVAGAVGNAQGHAAGLVGLG